MKFDSFVTFRNGDRVYAKRNKRGTLDAAIYANRTQAENRVALLKNHHDIDAEVVKYSSLSRALYVRILSEV